MPENKKNLPEIDKGITEEDQVRLKPIMGIRPGVYLAALYCLIIVLALFFLTIYPGLKNPGTVYTVKSEPAGAAIRVDGIYMNAAPCEIFIPKGRHTVEAVLPGFAKWSGEIESQSVLFLSLFFPRRASLAPVLKSPNPGSAFMNEAAEFAEWSFYGEATPAYQIPLVLSEAAYRLGNEAVNPAIRLQMNGTLDAAARFGITRSGMRDLVRARFLLDGGGQSPSPLTMLDSLEKIIGLLDENPETALWLAEMLVGEPASQIASSAWHKNAVPAIINLRGNAAWPVIGKEIITAGGMKFRQIIIPSENRSFYAAVTPVSRDLWEQFTNARPEWRAENIDSLIEKNLVNSQYLSYTDFPGPPENAAAWISWHAANAWCEWYGSTLPPELSIVRLPDEAEWEMAAIAGIEKIGDFWEWCGDSFAPLNFFPSSSDFESPEKSVRGGSWINGQQSINIETRGSLPPQSCSPFVSFRPVIGIK